MRQILNKANYVPTVGTIAPANQPSLTVPDQTMSLREMLNRHARGLPLTGVNMAPEYDEEGEGIDMRTLDMADIQEIVEQRKNELNEIKQRLNDEKKKKEDSERAKAEQMSKELEELRAKIKGSNAENGTNNP